MIFKIAQDAAGKYNLPNDVRFRIKNRWKYLIQIEKRPKESHYLKQEKRNK
jgi:hypothetical protein